MPKVVFAFMVLFLVLLPLALCQFIFKFFPMPVMNFIPLWFHRLTIWLFQIKIEVRGEISSHQPTIFIANHWSWIDISVLGSVLKGRFVAKQEIAGWPLFGFLAKLQNTIFVKRENRRQVSKQASEIETALSKGHNIILFAEGTSNDGNRILNFKSSLFSVAKPTDKILPVIQPVTIYYERLFGMPLERKTRPFIAWYGDMTLLGHLKELLCLGPITVVMDLGDLVFYDDFPSRKHLCHHVEGQVRDRYNHLHLRRGTEP